MLDLDWFVRQWPKLLGLLGDHAVLSYVPTLIGLVLSVVIGVACVRWRAIYPAALLATTVLFAVPSLALFVLLLPLTGLSVATAIIPLSIYTASMLVRNVVEGMDGTHESVRQAATAIGLGTWRRLLAVELPSALPVVFAGLRVALVTNIALASIVSVIGLSSLGDLFIDGTQRSYLTPIVAGIVLTMGMAVVSDLAVVALQRLVVRWDAEGSRK